MIPVTDAFQLVQSCVRETGVTKVPLTAAIGKVLREPIYADRDFPPFHRVVMDGIAVSFARLAAGQRAFAVAGTQLAGVPPQMAASPDDCWEVMTGAVLPAGTDTVICYEDLAWVEQSGKRFARVEVAPEAVWQYIHRQGTDRSAGDLLVSAGIRLTPAEIGVAASVGKSTLRVSKPLALAVVSTGDELVAVDQVPLPHQIRRSNAYALAATFLEAGAECQLFHVPDDPQPMRETLAPLLTSFDGVVLSGGVSMGKSDFLPGVLQQLGVQSLFHKVAQRPGKPFWFGKTATGTSVFAFPGNPVSTFLGSYKYLLPWFWASMGRQMAAGPLAVLSERVTFTAPLTYFLPVRTAFDEAGRLLAHPLPGSGSGDYANLLEADGFLELPAAQSVFEPGAAFPLIRFR